MKYHIRRTSEDGLEVHYWMSSGYWGRKDQVFDRRITGTSEGLGGDLQLLRSIDQTKCSFDLECVAKPAASSDEADDQRTKQKHIHDKGTEISVIGDGSVILRDSRAETIVSRDLIDQIVQLCGGAGQKGPSLRDAGSNASIECSDSRD